MQKRKTKTKQNSTKVKVDNAPAVPNGAERDKEAKLRLISYSISNSFEKDR